MHLESILTHIPWSAVVLLIFIIILYMLLFKRKFHGPYGLPYFGLYPFSFDDVHIQLAEIGQKRYGDAFLFRVTGQLFLHLGSVDVIREALVKKIDCFALRNRHFSFARIYFADSILYEEGEPWKVLRKFFMQGLRELSSTHALTGPVEDAVSKVVKDLNELNGQPVNLANLLSEPCCAAASQMCFGNSAQDYVPKIIDAYLRMTADSKSAELLLAGPILKYILMPFSSINRTREKGKKDMYDLLYKFISEREIAIKSGNAENSLVDLYIQERNTRKEKGDPQAEFFKDSVLVGSLIQMFGDATTGIAAFNASMLGDLSTKPDVQEKMRKEMNQVIGSDNFPTWEDKVRLPYVNAAIKELLRCNAFFPIIPSNECTRETTIGGINVPVGAVTVFNFWAVNHNPKTYKNPKEFRPERFLSSSSEDNTPEPQPSVFGVGSRSCAGEALTMKMIFCLISAVVQRFDIRLTGKAALLDRAKSSSYQMADEEVCCIPVKGHSDSETSKE